MAKKQIKTNAARLLDNAGIAYELVTYEVDENDLGAEHLAATIGQDVKQVFKTLVLRGDKTGFLVCVIPGAEEVDLKKAAKVSGNKKVEMIHMKELLPTTGYIRGGCSPIGMKKTFPTYFHQSCNDFEHIFVSAGMRGLQFKIPPATLVTFVHGTVADLIVDNQEQ
ncbi:MAG: Cys-tRNA(Pro) deacylase [Muribaculaceae bacterium]|nr:Cys-tRNA(Pro) deacylase [Muribaculaceae bacterium]